MSIEHAPKEVPASANAPLLLTVPQTAQTLSVSETTVWRMVANGLLDSVKVGSRRLVQSASAHRVAEHGSDVQRIKVA